ncbi:hypothetical protein BZA77DRAFT_105216 [Pyronema omphalodes]|nr:hypothetical protein BZA77DRAFT_105216 [Pyronema omphalodes]
MSISFYDFSLIFYFFIRCIFSGQVWGYYLFSNFCNQAFVFWYRVFFSFFVVDTYLGFPLSWVVLCVFVVIIPVSSYICPVIYFSYSLLPFLCTLFLSVIIRDRKIFLQVIIKHTFHTH